MSTPDTPETPALTRRQLRELRQTGATPIITPHDEPEVPDAAAPAVEDEAPAVIEAVPAPEREKPAEDATPEPATPAAFEAYSDAGAEFGVSGLTRRQAREQEKIRTASVPIISSDLEPSQPVVGSAPKTADEAQPAIFRPAPAAETPAPTPAPAPSVVNPALGSELLDGATPDVTLPASFDQLLARTTGATGTVSTPNSLILSQTPTGAPLVGPVTATGEIMITGTFDLPEGLGSVGHAPGTTDGRDADAVLLDSELPAASSPTPIAASAAISTVKQPGEIIRPPAPEKGSKLLVGLIITTGALFLAVVATLGLAFTTGVFR